MNEIDVIQLNPADLIEEKMKLIDKLDYYIDQTSKYSNLYDAKYVNKINSRLGQIERCLNIIDKHREILLEKSRINQI